MKTLDWRIKRRFDGYAISAAHEVMGWGITYGGQGCGLNMEAYTDSDFGACLDTRHSVSGAVVMLAKGAANWHSRMQAVTASSTSEAEYVALSEAVKEVIFLRQVQEFVVP